MTAPIIILSASLAINGALILWDASKKNYAWFLVWAMLASAHLLMLLICIQATNLVSQ